jgi:predicted Abi (CAAX) family protease
MGWLFAYRSKYRIIISLILVLLTSFLIIQVTAQERPKLGNYAVHSQQDFNKPVFYPINQTVDLKLYQPVGKWVGRLILPKKEEITDVDWVWFEVKSAPLEGRNLFGKMLRLEWQNKPDIQAYIKTVSRDINFTAATKKSELQGTVHPSRLDGRLFVGPLQSLAGARPNDDVIVSLDDVNINNINNQTTLQIGQEPLLVTGRYYGLVNITSNAQSEELFNIRHYNFSTKKFDGVSEVIRIPQQVTDRRNISPSTINKIQESPAGKDGWYIYGANDSKGVFTVQALAPRSLFKLQPNQVILDGDAGFDYVKQDSWSIKEADKGSIRTLLVDPGSASKGKKTALSKWREGDRAIAIHLFGGIGGKKAEIGVPGSVTGHFAFGLAKVIRDPFTKELVFDVNYQQIYASNSDGIISGTHSWANYMGNLSRGWVFTRPVIDILVKFDPITQDYDFDGVKISPLQELNKQLEIMMARYRVGDGTGSATVTASVSCVQDSNQALFTAIKYIKEEISSTPKIQKWLETHPNHPQTLRFQKLLAVSYQLEKYLSPLGIVRSDWNSNPGFLTGIEEDKQPFRRRGILAGLTTWRSITPRQGQDELAYLLFKNGASLWYLQTYQIGGLNSDIAPIAATVLFGRWTIPFTNIAPIPILIARILSSIAIPDRQDLLIGLGILLIYSGIALPLGFRQGFLKRNTTGLGQWAKIGIAFKALITPAILEELIFRVLPLPHPMEILNWVRWIILATVILVLFLIYHPLNAQTFFKNGKQTFSDKRFLILAAFLAIATTTAYALTGSLWIIAFIHWVVVIAWLLMFGGLDRLEGR